MFKLLITILKESTPNNSNNIYLYLKKKSNLWLNVGSFVALENWTLLNIWWQYFFKMVVILYKHFKTKCIGLLMVENRSLCTTCNLPNLCIVYTNYTLYLYPVVGWRVTVALVVIIEFISDASPEEPFAVVFSVTSNHHQNVEGGKSVQYHTKLVDDYDSFDLESGVYTCPSGGYYIFHLFRYYSWLMYHWKAAVTSLKKEQTHSICMTISLPVTKSICKYRNILM